MSAFGRKQTLAWRYTQRLVLTQSGRQESVLVVFQTTSTGLFQIRYPEFRLTM
jgi:hypothetical protein